MKNEVINKKIAILHDRADMLAKARNFFQQRNIREVDCPILTIYASVDAHIDLIPSHPLGKLRYLHSSPEYGMKRLLGMSIGDIFQLSHVFRDGEHSEKHNPEFTMAEWYRLDISFPAMIEETVNFIRLFVGDLAYSTITYREAFLKYTGLDYVKASQNDLINYLNHQGIELYPEIEAEGRDAILNLILGTKIEPQLGLDGLCVLAYYPASQAALSQTRRHNDEDVGERFEIYYKGLELANGYHELTDGVEQRRRFEEENKERLQMGKKPLPIDELFLEALLKGLPDSCGVAVGFDRLMMLRHQAKNISDVISFGWLEA